MPQPRTEKHAHRPRAQQLLLSQCAVHLTHRATPSSNGGASRVRIDSLVLTHGGYPPTQEWNYALKWANSSERQTMRSFLERHGGRCA